MRRTTPEDMAARCLQLEEDRTRGHGGPLLRLEEDCARGHGGSRLEEDVALERNACGSRRASLERTRLAPQLEEGVAPTKTEKLTTKTVFAFATKLNFLFYNI